MSLWLSQKMQHIQPPIRLLVAAIKLQDGEEKWFAWASYKHGNTKRLRRKKRDGQSRRGGRDRKHLMVVCFHSKQRHTKHTHTNTLSLSLCALLCVRNEAFAVQSLTERALPPGSIHRRIIKRGGGGGVRPFIWRDLVAEESVDNETHGEMYEYV